MNIFKKVIKEFKEFDAATSYRPNGGYQPTKPMENPQPPKTGSSVQPKPNYVPPPSVEKPKKENGTMSALKLYFTLDDLNTYIRNHTDEAHKNHTFIPVKVDFNEHSMEFEICLLSADPIEPDGRRYRVNLNQLSEDDVRQHNTEPCRDCAYGLLDAPQCKHCNAGNNYEYFRMW